MGLFAAFKKTDLHDLGVDILELDQTLNLATPQNVGNARRVALIDAGAA